MIKQVWRCTCRPRLSELRDVLGGCNWASLVRHLEAKIEWTHRCTLSCISTELRVEYGGRDRASFGMHFEADIEWTHRCNGRPWLNGYGDAIGGRDRVNSGIHLVAVIKREWRCARAWLIKIGAELRGGRFGSSGFERRSNGSWDSIHWITHNVGNVENWVQHGALREQWDWLGAEDSQSWDDAALGVCCTWCWLMIIGRRDREGWLNFLFLGDGRVEDEKERDGRRWGKCSWETGT